ncbi:MAG: DNA polymerase III subunit delta [Succinivibrionaceae bacterium]
MKVNNIQLINNLKNGIAPVYIISCDDPFWHFDLREQIIKSANNFGYNPKSSYTFDSDSLDLEALDDSCTSPGLFANTVTITLNLTNTKKKNNEALKIILRSLNPTLLPIINIPKITNSELNTDKTLSELANKGVICIVYDLTPQQLNSFIIQRAKEYGLEFDRDGVFYLQEAYEGNLAAIIQTFKKFNLCGYKGFINTQIVKEYISPINHYSIYDLAESFIDNNISPTKRLTILQTVIADGSSFFEIISKIGNAITTLSEMRNLIERGLSLDDYFANHRILKFLPNKRVTYANAAQSINSKDIMYLFELLTKADIASRSFDDNSALIYLRELAVARSYPNIGKISQEIFY